MQSLPTWTMATLSSSMAWNNLVSADGRRETLRRGKTVSRLKISLGRISFVKTTSQSQLIAAQRADKKELSFFCVRSY